MQRFLFPGRLTRAGLLVFGLMLSTVAFGRGILVSPTQLGLLGKPGQTVSGILFVSSSKEEQNRVTVSISDFTRNEEGNVVELSATHRRSCKSWLDVDRNELTSPETGRVQVVVSARIPADASGSYWALVGLRGDAPPVGAKSGVVMRVVPRVAIPVIVTVEGTAKPQVRLVETRAYRSSDGVDITAVLENSGNTAALVSGSAALEKTSAGSDAIEEIGSHDFGPFTSLPGTKLRVTTHVPAAAVPGQVQARTYVRFGPRAEDTAEGAAAIEAAPPVEASAKHRGL